MSEEANKRQQQNRQGRNTTPPSATLQQDQAATPAPATPVTQLARAGLPEPANPKSPWGLLESHLALQRELRQRTSEVTVTQHCSHMV